MEAAAEELRVPVFQVEQVTVVLWILFPADHIVQADFKIVITLPLSQVALVVADQLDQPMDQLLEAHNPAGVAVKADQLALIYKMAAAAFLKRQEDHLLTAAPVVQLVHHGAGIAATVPNNWVEQIKAVHCVQHRSVKTM
jgi:hypothetical protein